MTSKKRERVELESNSTLLERREDDLEVVLGNKLDEEDILGDEHEIEKYISENVLVSPDCESCVRMKNRTLSILNDSEKSLMIQASWSNLINNFTFKFVPRLLSKPYSLGETNQKFKKVVERLIFVNVEKESNRINATKDYSGKLDHCSKTYILPCQHPVIYSTNIQCLAPIGSDYTGLTLIDELNKLLHSKELVLCQKFIVKSCFQIGNLYRHELNSLNWGVNGTVYRTGENKDIPDSKKEKARNAHFNIKYSYPELYLPLSNTPLTFIKEPGDLRRMIDDILNSMESHYSKSKMNEESSPFLLAIDVEHHSNQSYKGFVSLIQLSTRTHDYIIDPFNLFNEIRMLNDLTANPRILKVLHGSDYDIIWLQRDFSVYIVNMFDTGQAARILNTPGGFSLKNLLSIYCSLDIDKRFQLADWRERPLSNELIEYARGDTHYLLYIYDIMKNLLLLHTHKKTETSVLVSDAFMEVKDNLMKLKPGILERMNFGSYFHDMLIEGEDGSKLVKITDLDPSALLTVLHNSRQICLKEYFEKPLDVWSLCYGVRTKLTKSSYKTPIDSAIVTLISYYLFVWRDSIARLLDVSASYVLKESMIIKICQKQPMNSIEILGLYPNVPANIKRHSDQILNIVTTVKNFITSKSEDELFDFNSFISHIYSKIANSNTNISDLNKYMVKNNYKVVPMYDNNDSACLETKSDSNQTFMKDKEISSLESHLSGHQLQDIPMSGRARRRSVTIKKNSPDSNDRLADNLFGNSYRSFRSGLNSSDSPLNINEGGISNMIIRDINNTLNGEIPSDFRNKKLKDIKENSPIPVTSSEFPEKTNTRKEMTFEEYYSEKTKEDSIEDESFTPLLSVKDKYIKSNEYFYKKQKNRKIKAENDHGVHDISPKPLVNTKKEYEGNAPDISNIIKENANILPASFACKSELPGFIKNSQKEGVANKSKKYIESMKTKKWHKKR
ncbi:RRPp PMC2 like exosome exoribonuclease subunit [Cryptosporidium sp. chipmunk genotype I]|uniref:RRPp PMC2 like exosome exoribonuclease subunit n=1 Tax=Cryptosporidium sp. chipmunk genotype I TaxID=1280935 RepID=UPI00351A6549|nr:RRPp PMC2 like exosome exoribonuclease subunit [Cryptosporidium sp. chipmunk genotype I]